MKGQPRLLEGMENLYWVLVANNEWKYPMLVGDRSRVTAHLRGDVRITFMYDDVTPGAFSVQATTRNDKTTAIFTLRPDAYNTLDAILRVCFR